MKGTIAVHIVGVSLLALIAPALSGCATAPAAASASTATAGFRQSRAELAEFVGAYAGGDGGYHVTYGASQDLRAFGRGGLGDLTLRATGPGTFEVVAKDGGARTVQFEREGGRVAALVVTSGGKSMRYDRAAPSFLAREVSYRSDVPLVGTLYSPLGPGPFPAAVIVHGSGKSDRDSAWYQRVAELLVRAGYVVLLPDKRGSGRSGGDWQAVGFGPLADDALAGVRALAGERDVRADKIGLVGVSQGGWVAPLAAQRTRDVAFVVDLVGAAVTPVEQVMLEIENTLRDSGVPEDGIKQLLAMQRLGFDYIATGKGADAYLARYDELLKTPLAPAVKAFPRDVNSPEVLWWRGVHDFNPVPIWASLCHRPTFVAYGADDERDNVPVAESVRRLRSIGANTKACSMTLNVYDGVGHSLSKGSSFHSDFERDLTGWLARVGR